MLESLRLDSSPRRGRAHLLKARRGPVMGGAFELLQQPHVIGCRLTMQRGERKPVSLFYAGRRTASARYPEAPGLEASRSEAASMQCWAAAMAAVSASASAGRRQMDSPA